MVTVTGAEALGFADHPPQWEVATACSRLLGRHFRRGGLFEGMVINIDSEATETVLKNMDAHAPIGEALFLATDATEILHIDKDGISHGCHIVYANDECKEKREIRVAITGFSKWQKEKIKSRGWPETVEDYMGLPSPIAVKPIEVQKTSLHELRHMVDSVDENISALAEKNKTVVAKRERLHKRAMLAAHQILYGLFGFGVGATASAEIASSSRLVMIGAGAVTGTVGLIYSQKSKEKEAKAIDDAFKDYRYRASLKEKRARAAERKARHFPQIINIHSATKTH